MPEREHVGSIISRVHLHDVIGYVLGPTVSSCQPICLALTRRPAAWPAGRGIFLTAISTLRSPADQGGPSDKDGAFLVAAGSNVLTGRLFLTTALPAIFPCVSYSVSSYSFVLPIHARPLWNRTLLPHAAVLVFTQLRIFNEKLSTSSCQLFFFSLFLEPFPALS